MVENTGPLWMHSLFSFESQMGVIKRMKKTCVDVVETIAFNYCLDKPSKNELRMNQKSVIQILRCKEQNLPNPIQGILIDAGVMPNENGNYAVGYEFKQRGIIYKSEFSKQTQSVDSFIQLSDNSIGEIQYFINSDKNYCVVKTYDVVKKHFHLVQIAPTKNIRVYACEKIQAKRMYSKYTYSRVACVEIVTKEPNYYEGN